MLGTGPATPPHRRCLERILPGHWDHAAPCRSYFECPDDANSTHGNSRGIRPRRWSRLPGSTFRYVCGSWMRVFCWNALRIPGPDGQRRPEAEDRGEGGLLDDPGPPSLTSRNDGSSPPRRGDVLDPTRGSEIRKTRPCVVVSPDELNDGNLGSDDHGGSPLPLPDRVPVWRHWLCGRGPAAHRRPGADGRARQLPTGTMAEVSACCDACSPPEGRPGGLDRYAALVMHTLQNVNWRSPARAPPPVVSLPPQGNPERVRFRRPLESVPWRHSAPAPR